MRELLKREGKKKDNFFLRVLCLVLWTEREREVKVEGWGGRVMVTGHEQDGFETVSNKI